VSGGSDLEFQDQHGVPLWGTAARTAPPWPSDQISTTTSLYPRHPRFHLPRSAADAPSGQGVLPPDRRAKKSPRKQRSPRGAKDTAGFRERLDGAAARPCAPCRTWPGGLSPAPRQPPCRNVAGRPAETSAFAAAPDAGTTTRPLCGFSRSARGKMFSRQNGCRAASLCRWACRTRREDRPSFKEGQGDFFPRQTEIHKTSHPKAIGRKPLCRCTRSATDSRPRLTASTP
jgi:hypothetical protein